MLRYFQKGSDEMINKLIENWSRIKEHLKEEYDITEVSYKTWILPLKIDSLDGNTVSIIVPDGQYAIDHINKKYSKFLEVSLAEVMNQEFQIKLISPEEANKNSTYENKTQEVKKTSNLNTKYTFDTFVKGDNNTLAFNAALTVAESPATSYNPLFLYGGVGLGKTHLMCSIVDYINKNNPSLKVIYVTSEEFTNDLIESIKFNKTSNKEFREKYRSADVLLIDDIQFIIGKETTQEEFFHTFNALYLANKQIVISSDKPPKEMITLEERFRSRFNEGLVVDIQPPTYETRMAILMKKAEMDGYQGTKYNIPDEVFEYIATHIKSNIRELEGALTKIVFYAKLSNIDNIDVKLAENVLKDLISPDAKREITPELIIQIVAEHFNISPDDISSSKKSQDIAYPRQIVMYLCRKLTDVSYKSIGSYLGKKDHSTILYGVNKIEEDIKESPALANTIDILIKKISPSI